MFAQGAASITAVPVAVAPPVIMNAATAAAASAARPAPTHFVGANARRSDTPVAECGTACAVTVGAGSVPVGAGTATGATDVDRTAPVSGRSHEDGGSAERTERVVVRA